MEGERDAVKEGERDAVKEGVREGMDGEGWREGGMPTKKRTCQCMMCKLAVTEMVYVRNTLHLIPCSSDRR